ncbi:hypothetical protein F4825DRAFT_457862 [Nemania diffusa]|nr:hypothetical protein F4825DRAFT_457862 [Nemania diffusa]
MSRYLETLPVELAENLVTFLTVQETGALRLTSRNMEDRVSQGSFRRRFHRETLNLLVPDLQRLAQRTERLQISREVQHLIIWCSMNLDSEEEFWRDIDEIQRLLTVIFRNLKHHINTGVLRSLSFRANITNFRALRQFWPILQSVRRRAFEVTMKAIRDSRLSVGELDLSPKSTGCGLDYRDFLPLARDLNLARILRDSEQFTLSLMPSTRGMHPPFRDPDARHQGESIAPILRALPDMMRHLESLDLHWVSITADTNVPDENTGYPQLDVRLDKARRSTARPRKCTLHGLYVYRSDLLRFVDEYRPTTLKMKRVRLVSGSKSSVLRSLQRSGFAVDPHY